MGRVKEVCFDESSLLGDGLPEGEGEAVFLAELASGGATTAGLGKDRKRSV